MRLLYLLFKLQEKPLESVYLLFQGLLIRIALGLGLLHHVARQVGLQEALCPLVTLIRFFEETFQALNPVQGEEVVDKALLVHLGTAEEVTVTVLGEHTGCQECLLIPNVLLDPLLDRLDALFDNVPRRTQNESDVVLSNNFLPSNTLKGTLEAVGHIVEREGDACGGMRTSGNLRIDDGR